MPITGGKKHAARLKRMQNSATKIVGKLYAAGQQIELDAEFSITEGSVSGSGHVASLPGQPPNADTRFLDTNIETEVITQDPPTVHITSKAPYSSALEFGTSKMAERPFMRPATEKNREEVTRKVAEAVNINIRRG